MTMHLKNLAHLDASKRKAIRQQATQFRTACNSQTARLDSNRG